MGFILNMEKSILNPVQEIKFLGLTKNSVKRTLSLPEQRTKRIQDQCQNLYVKGLVTVLELTKLIGLLVSRIQVALPAQLNFRYLQQPQINGVKERTIVMDSKSETLQKSIDNTTSVLCYNKNRCLQEEVGCILSRNPNRRGMDMRGKGNAHKHFEIEGTEVNFNVISQANENESSLFSNRQRNSFDVLIKHGVLGTRDFWTWPRIYGIISWRMGSRLCRIWRQIVSQGIPRTVQIGNFFPKYFIKFAK